MRWYEQQRQTSTRFQSIEHRENTNGPFYHQFLLLKLTDGAVCRVERTGDGSRADALRYTGCTSNDLIQWFKSADDYAKFSEAMPSNIVAEIDLQQEFDILDVLAVCYSIQMTKACRVYTLQRYNCYFFCWTILAVLTRRLWETTITNDAWHSAVNSVVDHWSNVSPEEAKKHLILRTCTLSDPDNARATMQFLNPLRSRLSSETFDLLPVNQALGMTLWATSYESALNGGLKPAAGDVRKLLCADNGVFGTYLQRARDTSLEKGLEGISFDPLLEEVYWDNTIKSLSRTVKAISRAVSYQLQLREIEQPLPFIKLAQFKLFASLESLAFLFGGNPLKGDEVMKACT
ncbi:hypothetical protein FS749_003579 [Ceratobasidium sp. UAMH 11750]|nr:hypothetical protein FS749_003579 [Ceratobasidium sp. UAMH 11750]